MKRLLVFAALLAMTFAITTFTSNPANAGTVPPPASCDVYPNYHVEDSACWGNAGNPPTGCLNGRMVSMQIGCQAWRANLPVQFLMAVSPQAGGSQPQAAAQPTAPAPAASPSTPSVEPTAPVDAGNVFKLNNGLTYFALIAAVGGMFISSAMWAMGSKGNSEGQAASGKRGFVVSLTAAFLIGALPAIYGWVDDRAHQISPTTTQSPGDPTTSG